MCFIVMHGVLVGLLKVHSALNGQKGSTSAQKCKISQIRSDIFYLQKVKHHLCIQIDKIPIKVTNS